MGAHYGVHMFQIRRETGQLDGVRDLITGQEPAAGCWAPALLALYTELRMARPARRLLDALADEGALRRNRRTEYMPTVLAYLVEAALFLDDPATLRRLRPLVAEHRGLNLVSDQFVALSGAADRYLGMIDAALGDADPIPSFDAAAELARRCGFAVDLALTLTARARHLARIHGPAAPDVLDAVAQARAIAEPIGQRRVLRALAGTSAAQPLHGTTRPARADHGLTERELEVLRLLCRGRVEPRDRPTADHQREHRRQPRALDPDQDRQREPHPGGDAGRLPRLGSARLVLVGCGQPLVSLSRFVVLGAMRTMSSVQCPGDGLDRLTGRRLVAIVGRLRPGRSCRAG